jgi:tripartite-type tricarboxylate transporter receptor subunit TctC
MCQPAPPTALPRRLVPALLFLLGLAFGLCSPATAPAQNPPSEWPTRPVRLITPFPAGAGPEVILRLLAEKLQKRWGKPVVVENRPGGNGFIAIDAFKRGAADGTDLIQLENVQLVAYPHLFHPLPYDPATDFEPLAPLFRTYFFVAVAAGSPYRSVGDIVADARSRPGQLNYGSWSVGNAAHLGSALLGTLTQTEMQHIVYKETSQLYAGVASGELQFALGTLGTAGPTQRTGRIRFIAITSPQRQAAFPGVPTVAESGGPPGFEVTGWTTLAAPRGLAPAVAEKIRRDVQAALAEPDIQARYSTFGYEPFHTSPSEFSAFIQAQSHQYAEVIRRANVKVD